MADQLLHKNIKLILNDISSEAIKIIKDRIGENAAKIKWICQDNLVKKMTLNKTATIKFNKRNTSWGTLLISTFDFEPLICP